MRALLADTRATSGVFATKPMSLLTYMDGNGMLVQKMSKSRQREVLQRLEPQLLKQTTT